MRLLCVLAERPGVTVTKEELIERLWNGRAITDDAFHRQLSKLRRGLADTREASRYLETVPKIGIRLIVEPAPLEGAPASKKSDATRWLAAAGVMLVAILGVGAYMARVGQERPPADERPITSDPGMELLPALSPNGRLLAYMSIPLGGKPGLVVRPVGEATPKTLPNSEFTAWPVWSPQGDEVAAVRSDAHSCAVVVFTPLTETSRTVSSCFGKPVGLAWARDGLILAERPSHSAPYALFKIDPRTGRKTQLTYPENGSRGDILPSVSPGGDLYFARALSETQEFHDVWRMADARGRPRRITKSSQWIGSISATKGGILYLLTETGNRRVIARLNVKTGQSRIISPSLRARSLAAAPDGSFLVLDRLENRVSLWSQSLEGGEGRQLTATTLLDWRPSVSPDGATLAFVSLRSGWTQLWLQPLAGGTARQLTRLDPSYVREYAWAPSGRKIVASLVSNGQFDLSMVDVATGEARLIASTKAEERNPSFTADGETLLFSRRLSDGWVLMGRSLKSGHETVVARGIVRALERRRTGDLIGLDDENQLRRIDSAGRLSAPLGNVKLEDERDWTVGGGLVWFVIADSLFWLDPDTGDVAKVGSLPNIWGLSGLAVHDHEVIYARLDKLDADLWRLVPGSAAVRK